MSGVQMKERIAAIVKAADKEPPEGFFRIVTPDVQPIALPDFATGLGQAKFNAILGDAELIILDNLSTLTRSGVENEGESWLPIAGWALERRREGRTVLFVHHAGKGGKQRGTSRREDALDVVIKLDKLSDFEGAEGARFRVIYEKTRGIFGADVEPIEAHLETDANGLQQWTWRATDKANHVRIAELTGLGMTVPEIAAELGIHRSTVYRELKKATR